MFSIPTTRLAGVVAVCALVVAPQALAKPLAHGAKAAPQRVHRVTPDDPAATTSTMPTVLASTGLGSDAYDAPWSPGPGV